VRKPKPAQLMERREGNPSRPVLLQLTPDKGVKNPLEGLSLTFQHKFYRARKYREEKKIPAIKDTSNLEQPRVDMASSLHMVKIILLFGRVRNKKLI
jgi:hypothetical protein